MNLTKKPNIYDSNIVHESNRNNVNSLFFLITLLNKDIYKCITEDIVTDEVIITDERIKHIMERHPNDYERYYKYMAEVIADPDYIVEANKPNTAFILKSITENDKKYELILRLATSDDPKKYKNSVITFLRVENKRYNRYLRTKTILYKKE